MIRQYSLMALQTALNRALSLDSDTLPKLKRLHGKIVQIVIRPLDVSFYIQFNQNQIELKAVCDTPPDTIIHSSPLGLIRLSLLPSSKVRSLFNDQIQISGDVTLGQDIKNIFEEIDVDWEGHLAHFTGDVVAHQVNRFVKRGVRFKQQLKSSLQHNFSDFIQEEANITPPKEALDDFMNDIDTLSMEVERLEAHIYQLLSTFAHETSKTTD